MGYFVISHGHKWLEYKHHTENYRNSHFMCDKCECSFIAVDNIEEVGWNGITYKKICTCPECGETIIKWCDLAGKDVEELVKRLEGNGVEMKVEKNEVSWG